MSAWRAAYVPAVKVCQDPKQEQVVGQCMCCTGYHPLLVSKGELPLVCVGQLEVVRLNDGLACISSSALSPPHFRA